MTARERQEPPGKAALAQTNALGQPSSYIEGLTACARDGSTVVACEEVVARLQAADRDARLGLDVSDLRHTADRIGRVHLDELNNRERS